MLLAMYEDFARNLHTVVVLGGLETSEDLKGVPGQCVAVLPGYIL